MERIERRLTVPAELAGRRLDQAAALLLPEFSRSRLKTWIDAGQLTLAGQSARARTLLKGGEELALVTELEAAIEVAPEPIPLNVVHEDDALLVIDKPVGLVVHPGAGNRSGTLQNALLHRYPDLATLPRAGLVHRLDKDTSGLLVVARTPEAHAALVAALAAREIRREYLAVCRGVMTAGGTIAQPIGRHRSLRTRMAVRADGREAVTHYRIVKRYRAHTLVRVQLETGRTHQIRVHLAHAGFPLVGDPVYGGRRRLPAGCAPHLAAELAGFSRQALHAARLALRHPRSGAELSWEAPVPPDMQGLLDALVEDAA